MKRQAAQPKTPAIKRFCGLRETPPRQFSANVGPIRSAAILNNQQKWVNGTTLNYWFFSGPATQKAAMRKAFKKWMAVGIGIRFKEVASRNDSQIRIAFANDGSWSYLGREILTISKSEPTMNIGWDISADLDTGVHEIGHTLGMPHEHQNPNAGIVWDEQAVYASLAQPPNGWDRQKTYWNIIRKLPANQVTGSVWDPDSIMHYPFEAGLILAPAPYQSGLTPAGGLSAKDILWAKKFYPPLPATLPALKPFTAQSINVHSGDQVNFAFKPDETRKYQVRTFGNSDAVMILLEENKDGLTYLAGNDDSGEDRNTQLEARLEKGKKYEVRLRMMYREPGSESAIMVW